MKTVETYHVVCLDVKHDQGEFDDLIDQEGKLVINGTQADFLDVELCGIRIKKQDDIIKIKTCFDNLFEFKIIQKKDSLETQLKKLVKHCWIHTAYPNCGYDQMTTEQKRLYDKIIAEDLDE